ncbi:glycoside hydrolase family 113 [Alicyclobacillus shizuokensis]|uniref:glycoside hydrolase family 113 n=1 Tax=Alicyclobacillus shizuokensis TaxID=392014 RepID=UPI00082E150B|nr:1,4-beta-xylanase [Alicyclobacillus shizuokensis]MCL6625893.1 1,4-beta-xylanase [Alicyclobacillus shizuokensis]
MEYIRGLTWGWVGIPGTWATSEAEHSMAEAVKLGINWVTLAFQGLQDEPQSTRIDFAGGDTLTDDEVIGAIRRFHRLGIKVCLKPVVNCRDGTWRAHINFFDHEVPGEPGWRAWWKSYDDFILHYADIAERTQCEMFCVGCEMVQADRRVDDWRRLVARVRDVYSGLVTYNCDKYQEERVQFWDAVDVISSSGYYALASWPARVQQLRAFAERWSKPFFFMEVGCPSRTGSAQAPYDWTHPGEANPGEQDEFYRTLFAALDKEPWFYGYMLWDWPAHLYPLEQASTDRGYCMYGKPAAERIRAYYAAKAASG